MPLRTGPTALFNGLLTPIVPYAMKGVIWHQGESNSGGHQGQSRPSSKAKQFRKAFAAVISDWRKMWGQGDFPFIYGQLENHGKKSPTIEADVPVAEAREAQLLTLFATPVPRWPWGIDLGRGGRPFS